MVKMIEQHRSSASQSDPSNNINLDNPASDVPGIESNAAD